MTLFAGADESRAQSIPTADVAAWTAANRVGTRLAYEQFLRHFSDSAYAEQATEQLLSLTLEELREDAGTVAPGIRRTSGAPIGGGLY